MINSQDIKKGVAVRMSSYGRWHLGVHRFPAPQAR